MPIFHSGLGAAPRWSEVEGFEILRLKAGEARTFSPQTPKEHLIVSRGEIEVLHEGAAARLGAKGQLALPRTPYEVRALAEAETVRLKGRWREITSSGVFQVKAGEPPERQSPHAYGKTTTFDRHYHDCDEVWVVLEGDWQISSEDRFYEIHAGEALATGMGWHHDVLRIPEGVPARGVWFEGTLEGKRRVGHLWEPVHGKAEPRVERV